MDKQAYLRIRKNVGLDYRPAITAIHGVQDAILVAVIGAISAVAGESAWGVLASPVVAVLIFRCFALMHEAVHGSVSKNRYLNDIAGVLSGAVCFLPFELWKRIHLEHHHWSGNVERDSVMAIVRRFPKWSPLTRKILEAIWRSWLPVLAIMQNIVFWIISFAQLLKRPASLAVWASVLAPLVFWGSIIALLPAASLNFIILPGIALYLLAVEVVNFPHHLGLTQLTGDEHLPAWEQHKVARSCIYPRWLARFVVLNFNYHVEHHMYPDAPWYHLDRLHVMVNAELKERQYLDPQFAWILHAKKRPLAQAITSPSSPRNQQHVA